MGDEVSSITKEAVDKLAADEILWDDVVRGFGVRRRGGAGAHYFVKYRVGKRQRWVTIGEHGSPWTPTSARKRALIVLGRVADADDPAETRDWEGGLPTVKEFSEEYVKRHAKIKKGERTVAEDERNIRLHILPAFGSMRIDAITGRDVARWHGDRSETPVNANRCLSLFRHMMRKAEAWGYRTPGSNPCRDVEKYEETPRERYLSAAELGRLGKALKVVEAEDRFSAYSLAALRVLVFTGARKMEIATLEWDHVDEDRGVARRDTKTGPRNIYLPPPALEIIKGLTKVEGSPWVFPSARDPEKKHIGDLEKAWRAVRKAAGLEDVHLHDLRHSFASVAVSAGDSLAIIGAVLGHVDTATTQRYAHLSTDPIAASASATAKRIEAAMGVKPGKKNVRAHRRR
jgi:integrase